MNQNISTSLVLEKENLEHQNITEYINYIWIFVNDKNAHDILNYLMNEFVNNRLSQPDIAFFFLSNQYNNSIIEFLNRFPDFRNKCLSCSKDIMNQATYNDSLIEFDSYKLRNITNEFMHFCIGNNSVDINKWIDYIRKVLSWICCQVKKKELFSNYELKRFMLIIPRLEQRLLYLGIDDKMIKLYIKKLKKSFCLTKMVYDSNKLLWQLEGDSLVAYTCSVGLLISYPEKFNLLYQFLMQQAVAKKRKIFKEQYHTYYRDAITLVFSIIPLGQINSPNQDIADKILSIINLFGGVK